MRIGLRIDVDTFRGTRYGVPNLCRLLGAYSTKASFFFSVGPDNMGRHLWRLLRPAFLWKMLRTKATSLYGWDILFKGTFWPGPVIGKKLAPVIRAAFDAGHEVGLHAWDHYAWQAKIDRMGRHAVEGCLRRGAEMLTEILGQPPKCFASPGWKCSSEVLLAESQFPFAYASDCRGESIFRPVVDGAELPVPQIPVTLPTYDEVVGRHGMTASNYNDYMLSLLDPGKLNVLTIHAEVEGIVCLEMFERFIKTAISKDALFVPLGSLLREYPLIGCGSIVAGKVPGRQGHVACQVNTRVDNGQN